MSSEPWPATSLAIPAPPSSATGSTCASGSNGSRNDVPTSSPPNEPTSSCTHRIASVAVFGLLAYGCCCLASAARRPAAASTYELRFSTTCLDCASFPRSPDGTHVITVVDGVAESPWNDAIVGATVDDWFTFLELHLDDAFALEAEFDAKAGFPTRIYFTSGEGTGQGTDVSFESWIVQDVAVQPTDGD